MNVVMHTLHIFCRAMNAFQVHNVEKIYEAVENYCARDSPYALDRFGHELALLNKSNHIQL